VLSFKMLVRAFNSYWDS